MVGSRTGVDLDSVLVNYVRGIDYDQTLEADLEGIRTRLNPDSVASFDQRSGGRSFVIDSAGLSSANFLRNVIDGHRSITFQLIPSDDKQEVWQWVVMLAVMVLVLAMLFY